MSLVNLLKIRAGSLTGSLKRVSDLANNNNLPLDALEGELRTLRKSYDQWSELWARVEQDTTLSDADLSACSTISDKLEQDYGDGMGKLYLTHTKLVSQQQINVQSVQGAGATGNSPSQPAPRVKLPEIKFLVFKGEVAEWEAWWTSFKDIVDDQPLSQLSISAKYQHLLSALEGQPRAIARSFPATAVGYAGALKSLKEHYADPAQQECIAIDMLLNLEFSKNNPDEVLDFKIKVGSIIQSWEGLPIDTKHPMIARLILSKLPHRYQQRIYQLRNTVCPTYQDIMESLKTIWERKDFPEQGKSDSTKVKPTGPQPTSQKGQSAPPTSKPSMAGSKPSPSPSKDSERKRPICKLCEGTHGTRGCTKYNDLKARQGRLKELNLCPKCCKMRHEGECTAISCYICKGSHHSWLHF